MSRSYRHTPICGVCVCDSEKWDKKFWHRWMRAAIRTCLHNVDADEVMLPHEHEVSDVWSFGKDGKQMFDPSEYPRAMRK